MRYHIRLHVQVLRLEPYQWGGPVLTIAWHINNLGRKFIIGPNIDYLFQSTKQTRS